MPVEVLSESILNKSKKEIYTQSISKNLSYGSNKQSLGIKSLENQPRMGPESFSGTSANEFIISDNINNRIQIFSSIGTHKHTIPLKNINANDVTIDENDFIFIYDVMGKLHQFSQSGNLLKSININNKRWKVRMPMHIVQNKIYMTNTDQKDILIGIISSNGQLDKPNIEKDASEIEKGIHANSGRQYWVELHRYEKGVINILNANGNLFKSVDIPLEGIVSITYLSEDRWGNFFIQTERTQNGDVKLEAHKFDADGNYLTTIYFPNNHYSCWTLKLLSVDSDGNIYQVVPARPHLLNCINDLSLCQDKYSNRNPVYSDFIGMGIFIDCRFGFCFGLFDLSEAYER